MGVRAVAAVVAAVMEQAVWAAAMEREREAVVGEERRSGTEELAVGEEEVDMAMEVKDVVPSEMEVAMADSKDRLAVQLEEDCTQQAYPAPNRQSEPRER